MTRLYVLLTTSARSFGIGVLLLVALPAAAQTTAPAVDAEVMHCDRTLRSSDPRTLADSYFERGRLLREQGKQAESCACFEASHDVMPGRGGTMLNVGVCRVQAGQLLSARSVLQDALNKAQTDARADREQIAREQLVLVDTRLARLELVPPENVDDTAVVVLLDDLPVKRESWASVPVEPGKHTISIQAQGYIGRQLEIVLNTSERRTVFVTQLQPDISKEVPALHEVASSANQGLPLVSPRDAAPRWSRLKSVTLILSAASLAVGIFAGSWALERKNAVHERCDANKQCSQAGIEAAQTGHRVALLSTTAFTIGAVGGVSWLLLPGAPLNVRWGRRAQPYAEAKR